MQFLGELFLILDSRAQVPKPYGWFHIAFWIISVFIGIWLCVKIKNPDEKTVRKILLTMGLICTILEIYKQTVYSFSYADSTFTFDYQWYAFPFQFCSMPMYVQLLAGLIKKGKVHDALCSFLATYSIFAGLCVMIYPNDVFTDLTGVNIQTMICHASMLTIGIFLLGSGYVKAELKTILKALPVFATAVGIAVLMNELTVASGILNGETFNMFFVSRHFEPSLPVYSTVQALVPYPWCLIIYVLAFSVASFIVLLAAMGIKKIIENARKKHQKNAA